MASVIYNNRPPLPFVGNKRTWAKDLEMVFRIMRKNVKIFDAFGGSFFVSRVAKNILPNARVVCNDYKKMYTKRLEAVGNTQEIYNELVKHIKPYTAHNVFQKLTEKEIADVKRILSKAMDYDTCATWFNNDFSANKLLRNFIYLKEDCVKWVDGLEIVDMDCTAIPHDYIQKFDVIILDPPYETCSKNGVFKNSTCTDNPSNEGIINFCTDCIKKCKTVIAFEKQDSRMGRLCDSMLLRRFERSSHRTKNKKNRYADDRMWIKGFPGG